MSFARLFDEPEEKLYWFCLCWDCLWESELHEHRDDIMYVSCPECGSENLRDEKTYV